MYRNGPPAISPDGTRVAFVVRKDGTNSLWLRPLDKLEASRLQGTDDAFFPFWSPDGTALAFFMRGKLWRMDLNGGTPVAICDAPEGRGGSWGRGNIIVFAAVSTGPLMQVPVQGGTPKAVTATPVAAGFTSDRWPFFLPDGKHFLYLHSPNGDADERNEIRYASLAGGADTLLLRGHYFTFQYASGWLLADRAGSLQAWRFDPSTGKLSGDAIQVVDKVASDEITGVAGFSISPQAILIYQPSSGSTGDRHVWLDETGKQVAQLSEPNIYGSTRISPDGSRIAVPTVAQAGDQNIWMWDLTGGTRAQLSSGGGYAKDMPAWSADGRTLYFSGADEAGHLELLEAPTDGSRAEKTLIKIDADVSPAECTSDGKWLLYEETRKDNTHNAMLKALPLAAGLTAFTVLDSVNASSNARLKPGTNDWLAYQSSESGNSEVYLTRFPQTAAKYQVSQSGASQPVWSRDGRKLYYLDSSQRMTVIDVQTSNESVQLGTPKTLFQTAIRSSIPTGAYDIARDGRFLVVNSVMESTAPVVLVTNWDAGLKK
jgi:Tol biopolymer transport system component